MTVLWILAAWLFQIALRTASKTDWLRMGWMGSDVFFLTMILRLRDLPLGPGIAIYPLLVAASGLWSRARIVWWTTAVASLGYLLLVVDASNRGKLGDQRNSANIALGALVITGFVVSQYIRRISAITAHYEKRAMPEYGARSALWG